LGWLRGCVRPACLDGGGAFVVLGPLGDMVDDLPRAWLRGWSLQHGRGMTIITERCDRVGVLCADGGLVGVLGGVAFAGLAHAATIFQINGGGYGHGIGMCQWGAIGRARAGQNFRTILEIYYPGTTIGRIAG